MNRKIYIPTTNELEQLEACKSINSAYEYVVNKVREKVLTSVRFVDEMDESLKDIYDLTRTICYTDPIKIEFFESAKKDTELCKKIAFKNSDESIFSLDYLGLFSENVQLDYDVICQTVHTLSEKLPSHPDYRFTHYPSLILVKIFLLELSSYDRFTKSTLKELATIDPAYGIRFRETYGINSFNDADMAESMYQYAARFGLDIYDSTRKRESVFKSENGKKLIKYLYNKQ